MKNKSFEVNTQEILNKKIPKVRDYFSEQVDVVLNTGDGLTQQEFKDETDINLILAKYGIHAIAGSHPPDVYRDISQEYDYAEAFEAVEEAKELFAQLPADARRKLNDDPVKLMELSQTEEGIQKLLDMGFNDPLKASSSKSVPEGQSAAKAQAEAKEPK